MGIEHAVQIVIGGSDGTETSSHRRLVRAIRPEGPTANNVRAANWRDYRRDYVPLLDDIVKRRGPQSQPKRRYYIWEPFGFAGAGVSRRDYEGFEECINNRLYWLTHGNIGIDPWDEFAQITSTQGTIWACHIGVLQPRYYTKYRVEPVDPDPITGEVPIGNPTLASVGSEGRAMPHWEYLDELDTVLGGNRLTPHLLDTLEKWARSGFWMYYDALSQDQLGRRSMGYAIAVINQSMTGRLSGSEGPHRNAETWLHGMDSMANSYLNYFRHFRDQLGTGDDDHPDPSLAGGDPTQFNQVYGGSSTDPDRWSLAVYNRGNQLLANPGTQGDLSTLPVQGGDLRDGSNNLVDSGLPGKLVYDLDRLTYLSQTLKQVVDYTHPNANVTFMNNDKTYLSLEYHDMTWADFVALAS